MTKVKTIPFMRQFYDKYFACADRGAHSVTTLGGLRSLPIHNELFVSYFGDEGDAAPFIKGEFGYFVPNDIIAGKYLTDCDKAIITLVTKDFKLVMLTVVATTRSEWLTITIVDDVEKDDEFIIMESTTPQTLLRIIKELCANPHSPIK